MGILISNAAMSTTLATLRTTDLPATLSIAYAAARANQPGMTYVETGRDLVALLRSNGWPQGRELRVQWAFSPPAPTATVNDVRNALAQAIGGLAGISVHSGPNTNVGLGARAYTGGSTPGFATGPDSGLMGHEAPHVVQQRTSGQNSE
jgi:Domain of unknown function (DUF4157)